MNFRLIRPFCNNWKELFGGCKVSGAGAPVRLAVTCAATTDHLATNCGRVSSLAADRQGAECSSARLRPVCWTYTASILAVVQRTEISRRQFWIHRGDCRFGASLGYSIRLNVRLLSPVTCWWGPVNSAKQVICYGCVIILYCFLFLTEVPGSAVGWDTALQSEVAGSIPDGVIATFH